MLQNARHYEESVGLDDMFIMLIVMVSLLVVIFNNMQFAWGLTNSFTATVGVLLISLATVVVGYKLHKEVDAGKKAVMLLVLIALLCFEWFHGFGFYQQKMSELRQEAIANSLPAQNAEKEIKRYEAEMAELASYNTTEAAGLASQVSGMEAAIEAKRVALANCPKKNKSACIIPRNEEIAALENELIPIRQQLDGYNAYQTALTNRDKASAALTAALSGTSIVTTGVEKLDAAFVSLATRFNTEPATVQLYWNMFLSLALMLIATFGLWITKKPQPRMEMGTDYSVTVSKSFDEERFAKLEGMFSQFQDTLARLTLPPPAVVAGANDPPKA